VCLWRQRWRLHGSAGIAVGLMSIELVRLPDITVNKQAKLMAVCTARGGMAVSSLRAARFNRKIWMQKAVLTKALSWGKAGAGAVQNLT
jgi:hypothetical protein